MGSITLITGGSRSGKSAFALRLAESQKCTKLFLATCPVTDEELAVRIQRHIEDRQQSGWETIEEQVDIAGRLKTETRYEVIIVDCLTLWINNLMYEAQLNNLSLTEDDIAVKTTDLVLAAEEHPGTIIFVTNEVGLGIVPENKEARLYRDLVGRCNQHVARASANVFLISCGIPLHIKGMNNAL